MLLNFLLILNVFYKKLRAVIKKNSSYTEKYQDHVHVPVYKFIKAILKEYDYCREVIKKTS